MPARSDITFNVREGEFVSLPEPSGGGKSTLLWTIAGLEDLDAGVLKIVSDKIAGPHNVVSVIFQERTLLPWRNMISNIKLPFELGDRAGTFDPALLKALS